MLIFKTKSPLIKHIQIIKQSENHSIGFIPTMGFLHQGQGQQIQRSIIENDITVCSIFVNPIQFDNKEDFEKYPRDYERDISFLKNLGCDILFLPDKDEMYPEGYKPKHYGLGFLEKTLEGLYRPGHFQGVAEIVRHLFEIVKPDKAYFGEKDYQQLLVIKKLVEILNIPVQIFSHPTIREGDGLALSSRNARLSQKDRAEASFIFEQLKVCKKLAETLTPQRVKEIIADNFSKNPFFELQYFELVDANSLKQINKWNETNKVIALVAAYIGGVRLIDNLLLKYIEIH